MDKSAVGALVLQRATLHRFLASRLGSTVEAEDLLRRGLLGALQGDAGLRRGERLVAWFDRILAGAIADHFREKQKTRLGAGRLLALLTAESASSRDRDWDATVSACFEGLLPFLNPRYAEIIRRVELNGEMKRVVAHEFKLSQGAFDVALHRARNALRRQLTVLCGACCRRSCLALVRGAENKPLESMQERLGSSVGQI